MITIQNDTRRPIGLSYEDKQQPGEVGHHWIVPGNARHDEDIKKQNTLTEAQWTAVRDRMNKDKVRANAIFFEGDKPCLRVIAGGEWPKADAGNKRKAA